MWILRYNHDDDRRSRKAMERSITEHDGPEKNMNVGELSFRMTI